MIWEEGLDLETSQLIFEDTKCLALDFLNNFIAETSPINRIGVWTLSEARTNPSPGLIPRAISGIDEESTRRGPYFATYSFGFSKVTPKFLNSLVSLTSGELHSTITFFCFKVCSVFGAGWKTTRRNLGLYSNHLSIIMSCGGCGNWGSRSVIILRGGGGRTLPGMTWCSAGIGAGACGGLSLIIFWPKIE